MEDRVRIYELSRRMNVPNAEIITTLRELGYDVKSHSSTVDSNAVGLLIAALGKKKDEAAQPKAKSKSKAAGASTKKASKVAPPPPAEKKKKPRVLRRYTKEEVAAQAAAAQAGAELTPAQMASPGLPPSGHDTLPASHISSTPRIPRPVKTEETQSKEGTAPAEPAPTAEVQPDTSVQETAPAKKKPAVEEEPKEETKPQAKAEEPEDIPSDDVEEQKPTGDSWSDESKFGPREIRNLDKHFEEKQRKEQAKSRKKDEEPEPVESETLEPDEGEPQTKKGKKDKGRDGHSRAVRPMSPSVPIRVAAPSMRATPPRPPKSHRHSQAARREKKEEEKKQVAATIEVPKVVTLTTNLTVQELADKMHTDTTEIIKHLFMKGIMRTVNQLVELEIAKELALELEYEVLDEESAEKASDKTAETAEPTEEDPNMINRPPVVTIMGHVDHGKTSLLDAIRQTKFKITDEEAGGITQHIGAYHVEIEHEEGMRQIVFLDTPGHEAFTAMRARGAKGADIAILVVAADDGVMPQTVEAIDHAKAAGVPIIVAVNKVDVAGANPDRVLTQLMEHELLADSYGGETVTVNVSAKKQTGLDELLEMIILVADLQDLRANPEKSATGVIVEAELSRGKGAVATALVQNGTLREGDYVVVGNTGGRVRALFDDRGHRVKAAGPSMPVEVLGIDAVPQAGDTFEVVEDIQEMKGQIEDRQDEVTTRRHGHVTLESFHDLLESGEVKELNVIVKADVQGTAQAIADSVSKLNDENVQVRVLRAASGDISENDVNLAASSEAIIIGFNSQPDPNARVIADTQGVDVRTYSIIYQITEDLTKAIQGLLEPIKEEVKTGSAEIRKIFKVGKGTVIAGCYVLDGKINRGSIARIEREGMQIYDGKIDTLKRFKDDVREVAQGYECGMSFERFTDLEEGDIVSAFIIKETKRGE